MNTVLCWQCLGEAIPPQMLCTACRVDLSRASIVASDPYSIGADLQVVDVTVSTDSGIEWKATVFTNCLKKVRIEASIIACALRSGA